MSDEPRVKERFDDVEGLRFYGILRVKSEVRRQGVDPKYTDKFEMTSEKGFVANSLEDLKKTADEALKAIIEEHESFGKKLVEVKEEKDEKKDEHLG